MTVKSSEDAQTVRPDRFQQDTGGNRQTKAERIFPHGDCDR